MTIAAPPAGIRIGPTSIPPDNRTLGDDVLRWIVDYLLQPDGPNAGQSFMPTREQQRFILNWYAIDERGRFVYRYGMLRRMKGWGKDPMGAVLCCVEFLGPCRFAGWHDGRPLAEPHSAAWIQTAAVSRDQTRNTMTLFPGLLSPRAIAEYGIDLGKEIIYAERGRRRIEAVTSSPRALEGGRATFVLKNEALAVDTRLPTPDGWTTVGQVQPGDVLYGRQARVTVMGTTPIYHGRPCYEVIFEDGTALTADAGHLWMTKVNCSAARPCVRTTEELFKDGRSFSVPLMEPLAEPDAPLPIDPYVFGLWLGDGDATAAGITIGAKDAAEVLAEVRGRGVPAATFTRTGAGRALRISLRGNDDGDLFTKDGSSVRGALSQMGVLGAKRIPIRYLRASRRQRVWLLRGLMDSDGCITPSQSQAIFVNQNRLLAAGLMQLVRSLGYRAKLAWHIDRRWKDSPICYRVVFRADIDVNPFALARKRDQVHGHRRPWKSITSIRPVPSVPVRCIQVDAEDHLFAAGYGWTLTHNTHHWIGSNEGHEMAKVIARNVAKSRDGSSRVLAISNAHAPGEDSDAERDYDAWRKIDQGLAPADILYDSLEAPETTDLDDDESVLGGVLAARGDSHWLDPERLLAEIRDPRTTPAMARRFYLNQIVAEEDKPFDREKWTWLLRPAYRVPDGAVITLGFDGSTRRDHTALIGTEVATGYQWVVGYWEPTVDEDTGESWIPFAEVDATVDATFRRWNVWRMYEDPSWWRDWTATWAGRYGKERVVDWNTTIYRKMATALANYRNAIAAGELSHDGDPRFAAAIANAHKHVMQFRDDQGEPMWIIQKERPDSPMKIDAAMAGCLSWAARTDALTAGARPRGPAADPSYLTGAEDDARGPEMSSVRAKQF